MDIKRVVLLIQYNVCDTVSTLKQRFGRAARDPSLTAICIMMTPSGYFYDEREKRLNKQEKRAAKKPRLSMSAALILGTALPNEPVPSVNPPPPEGLTSPDEREEGGGAGSEDEDEEDGLGGEELGDHVRQSDDGTIAASANDDPWDPEGATLDGTPSTSNAQSYIPPPTVLGKRKRDASSGRKPRFAVDSDLDAVINANYLPASDPRYNCRHKAIGAFFGLQHISE